MQDPDPKCRHFGILAFLPKSLIRYQIRFFRFFPIFRLFLTFRLSDSTALVSNHPGKLLHTTPPLSGNAHRETTHFKKGLLIPHLLKICHVSLALHPRGVDRCPQDPEPFLGRITFPFKRHTSSLLQKMRNKNHKFA